MTCASFPKRKSWKKTLIGHSSTDRPTDRPTDRSTDRPIVDGNNKSIDRRPTDRPTDRSVGRLFAGWSPQTDTASKEEETTAEMNYS
jgi:hypothetical protein